jgi:DNA modification methylase
MSKCPPCRKLKPFYQEEFITLYCGDARKIIPQLKKSFDLILTDPPYGTAKVGYGRAQYRYGKHNQNAIANDGDLTVAKEVLNLCISEIGNGWCLAFCAARRMKEAINSIQKADYAGEIIWDKGTPGMSYTLRYTHESSLLWKIGKPLKPTEPLMSLVRQQVNLSNANVRHPHEKPVSFWINALRLPGNLIIDPFCGSGSVLRAAKDLKRRAIGIELDEHWCKRTVENLKQETLF